MRHDWATAYLYFWVGVLIVAQDMLDLLQTNFAQAYEIRRVCWFLFRVTKMISDIEASLNNFNQSKADKLIVQTTNYISSKFDKPKVTENPFIGPEPKKKRMTAAIIVVTFASTIDDSAFSYPILIEL